MFSHSIPKDASISKYLSSTDVNVLRIGRIGLMYQTTDGNVSGAWDQESHGWVQLESAEYRNAILKGIRVAKKQASIGILNLPIAAPEAIQ